MWVVYLSLYDNSRKKPHGGMAYALPPILRKGWLGRGNPLLLFYDGFSFFVSAVLVCDFGCKRVTLE